MQKRIPLPNGTTIWVSPNIDAITQGAPPLNDASWIEVQRITSLSSAGGEEKISTYSPLGEYEDVRKPAGRNPTDMQISFEDSPDSAYFAAIKTARDSRNPLAWKFKLPGGVTNIVFTGYGSGSMLPVLDRNQLMTIPVAIAVIGTPQRITA